MSDQTTWTIICPHCGYESEDSAMCQSCGRLMDESVPLRPLSISGLFTSSMTGTEANWNKWNGNDDIDFDDKLRTHPSYAFNPGNIFYNIED